MPIFEYECKGCGEEFELLVRSDTQVSCPACGGQALDKKLSLFASHASRRSGALPSCRPDGDGCEFGRCGSGSCGTYPEAARD